MSAFDGKAAAEWRSFWTLPVAAALGYSIAVLHTYSLGAFFAPLQQEFGWTRAQISMGITIAGVGSAIFGVPVGILIDKFGPRLIALIGAFTMAGTVALLSTATGTLANWYLLWGIVALGTVCVHATVWTSAVASRFQASRGFAFAVTLSGASISSALFPLLATWLIGNYGWRTAIVGLCGIWFVLVFVVLLFFFRGAQDAGRKVQVSAEATAATPGLTLAEGLRTTAYYKLLLAAGFFAFTAIGITVHFQSILRDAGATPLTAASIAGLIGIFSIIGRLGTGFLIDRLPSHIVGATCFVLPIVAAALLLYDGANPTSQSIAAAIFGLTVGAEIDVIAYLATRQFGLKNFGGLFGGIVTSLALGVAFGPLAAGATFDSTGSYDQFLILTMVLMAASSIALASLRRAPFGGAH